MKESQIEELLIDNLEQNLKYTYRQDIRDKNALKQNFREKFETLNKVKLLDSEFARLHDEIVNADVFIAATTLHERSTFLREDGTALQYTLVNIKDWCKNEFEVINQLRINTDNSHQRYDVILLINGVPVVQIELKTLETRPRLAMEQIVKYKNEPNNGYTNTLLCFLQLFIVSNRSNTYYFANNHKKHFSFNADEGFLPIYQLASEDNKKITHLIEDDNVLRFNIDYFKLEGEGDVKPAGVKSILEKHDAATDSRRFNAIFATSSINDAIKYYDLFKKIQSERQSNNKKFKPLNIACVFSPPPQAVAKDSKNKNDKNVADIKQLLEDLPQEENDNQEKPEKKKDALKKIINDYNSQYGCNHSIGEFDAYYQDLQQRIKDQQYPNSEKPHENKR